MHLIIPRPRPGGIQESSKLVDSCSKVESLALIDSMILNLTMAMN
jgi:hypothetical protein